MAYNTIGCACKDVAIVLQLLSPQSPAVVFKGRLHFSRAGKRGTFKRCKAILKEKYPCRSDMYICMYIYVDQIYICMYIYI